MMASGDMPVVCPNSCGSTNWPMAVSRTINSRPVSRTMLQPGSTAAASASGNAAEMRAPIYGTNRKTAPTMPQRMGLGTPITISPMRDEDAEDGVDSRQRKEITAQPEGCVIERLCRAVQVVSADEPDEAIAKVLSLQQDENHEDDDDRCRRERRQQSRDDTLENLDRAGGGLMHLHGQKGLHSAVAWLGRRAALSTGKRAT